MSEHEELIKAANRHPKNLRYNGFSTSARVIEELIAALEAAKPRMVTTVEELDALPNGSVIRDRFHDVMERRGDLWCSFETTPFPSSTVARKYLPARVLFAPPQMTLSAHRSRSETLTPDSDTTGATGATKAAGDDRRNG